MPLRELNDNVARLTIRLNSGRNHQACGYGDPRRRSRGVWRFLRAPAVRAATFCGCTAGVPQPISLACCSSLRCQVRRLWEALGWIPKRSLPKLQLRHSPSTAEGHTWEMQRLQSSACASYQPGSANIGFCILLATPRRDFRSAHKPLSASLGVGENSCASVGRRI